MDLKSCKVVWWSQSFPFTGIFSDLSVYPNPDFRVKECGKGNWRDRAGGAEDGSDEGEGRYEGGGTLRVWGWVAEKE